MLRELRRKIIPKKDNKSLEDFLGKESRKYYLENNYKKNFLFKYLFFLRMKGADLNAYFDKEIKENAQNKKS